MIIAEIGQAHDGSLGTVHAYIDALAETGVNAIKFQMHIAEAESSIHEPFRVKFSKQDASRMDYWKRMEFTFEQWQGIKTHCEHLNMEFMASPFSNAAVGLLEKLNVKRYKIGSGEVNNLLMMKKIAETSKPIILSSGMSSYKEIDKTIHFLKPYGNHLSILQCTTAYPTNPKEWGLNIITELKNKYNVPVGFSDHSGDIYASLAAAVLGSEIFEFHVVFDKRQFGPDTSSSITIEQTKRLVKGIKDIRKSLSHPINKSDNQKFSKLKDIFEKSLAINKGLPKGHVILFSDLEAKKPAKMGIATSKFKNVIGKVLVNNLNKWDFINYEDLK
jgi:N-acetylneuraminate synthase